MKKQVKPRAIAPKLASGEPRDAVWLSLPEAYKEGWREIAESENESVSWCIQQVLIDFAHGRLRIPLPRYKNYVVRRQQQSARMIRFTTTKRSA